MQDADQKTQPVEIAIHLLLPLEERRLITLTSSFPFWGFHVGPQRTFQTLHADLGFYGLSYLLFLQCDAPTQAKCYLRAACVGVCRRLAHPRHRGSTGRRSSEHRLLSALQMNSAQLPLIFPSPQARLRVDICMQEVSREVLDGSRLSGKLNCNAFATEASADPTGSCGVKMALRSCTELRQGARLLHEQSPGAGCPWGGVKCWLSQGNSQSTTQL